VISEVADQPAVATAEVKPADARQATEQLLHDARDAPPLVLADGQFGVRELEAIVDARIRSFAGVVAIVVDAREVGPGVGDERKATGIASAQLVVTLAVAAADIAKTLGAGTTDAA
jgi:hypothetical protein